MPADDPASFRCDDLRCHFLDPLWSLQAEYWESIDRLADQYAEYRIEKNSIQELVDNLDEPEDFWDQIRPFTASSRTDVDSWLKQNVELESKYEHSRPAVIGHIHRGAIEYIFDRYRPGRGLAWSYSDGFQWIGATLASGIVGTLGYEAVKKAWGGASRLSRLRRRQSDTSRVDPQEALEYLVKLAVREQCQRHNFPLPEFNELRVVEWEAGAMAALAKLQSVDPEIQAIVEVPYSEIERHGLRVVIRRPGGTA